MNYFTELLFWITFFYISYRFIYHIEIYHIETPSNSVDNSVEALEWRPRQSAGPGHQLNSTNKFNLHGFHYHTCVVTQKFHE